jgi:hypothetical protein
MIDSRITIILQIVKCTSQSYLVVIQQTYMYASTLSTNNA